MRENEIDGEDYYFISSKEFEHKIAKNAFIEYEEVYKGNYYGTLKSEVDRIWEEGKHVVFDIDVIGGLNIKKQYGDKALAVFVQPPSVKELKRRLETRSTETSEKIQMRVDKAKRELDYASKFDFILINDNLDQAKKESQQLINNFI